MKTKILLSVASLFMTIVATASPITETEAQQKATDFMSDKKGNGKILQSKAIITDTPKFTTAESCDAFYVFNNETGGGYIIVSADDRMPAVLGYSYTGTFKSDEIPENMRSWLNGYVEQYEYMLEHDDVTAVSTTSVTGEKIYPLLTTKWWQNYPYNISCPRIDGSSTPTGCVATAMAQIMYYHQWPKQTIQTIPGYTTSTNQITVPSIGITSIDYDNMLYEYGNEKRIFHTTQEDAIANLMRLCGASVKMDYGVEESAASNSAAREAFVSYFGYNESSISSVNRSSYQQSTWTQLIYDEIKNRRPVLYSGKSSQGSGHAFIIDGYDDNDYFHVNWGWGGDKDDYFLLSSLNDYNFNQSAIIGIEPPNGMIEHKYAYATYKDNTLTFHYDNKREERQETIYTSFLPVYDKENRMYLMDWYEYAPYITSVVFDDSFSDFKQLMNTENWFWNMENLTNIQGLENIDTKQVTSMRGMFYNCKKLTSLNLSGLKTSNTKNMEKMFWGCENITDLDLSGFETNNVTNMSGMFEGCHKLTTIDVNSFNTENVINMEYMFYGCNSLTNLNLSGFNTRNVTDMSWMFLNCSSLTTLDVSNFNTQNVANMSLMFSRCSSLKKLDLSSFTTIKESEMGHFFSYCENLETLNISNIDISEATNLSYMFYNCKKLKNIDLGGFDTRSVTDMSRMFSGCESLEMLNVENFETGRVESMREMFALCENLNVLDVRNFDTQNVTDMSYMFYGCKNLTNLDLNGFNTQKVTDMSSMFSWCSNTKTIFVGDKWNTNKLKNSSGMFAGCFRLIGQDGTKYNSNNAKDATMAHYGIGGYLTYGSSSAVNVVKDNMSGSLTKKYYSIDGKRLSQPQKGLNIIKMSDGTTRKVVR